MLIVGSGVDGPSTQLYPQVSTPLTLQPTLVTDVVMMKDKGGELDPAFSVFFNTRTFFTTYTYFTTFFSDSSSIITSSEQVVSNVVTVPVTQRITPTASPTAAPVLPPSDDLYTIFDTSDRLITSTAYSTFTIYATLFNGSSSFVTPLEEVHTQMYTITEPITFTRVITPTSLATEIQPTKSLQPSTFEVTSTYYTTYTNFVTFFQGSDSFVSSIEETVSSVATLTLFGNKPSEPTTSIPTLIQPSTSITEIEPTPAFTPSFSAIDPDTDTYTTRTYVTTQTHYITLFSGSETVLSSIEEVGTQVRTEKVQPTPSLYDYSVDPSSSSPTTSTFTETIKETTPSTFESPVPTVKVEEGEDSVVQLQTSIRTLYTTFTYYTTYFSDTNTFISSREDVSTSYVTLFIPKTITPTVVPEPTPTFSSSSTSETTTSVLTTTEYSTLTLYTTLFDGDKEVVLSSEHVVPEVITATVTKTSEVIPEPSPTLETVLTYFTTYTFYDTYVSGTETLLTPSESVITNYVTASGPVDAISTRQTDTVPPPITISEDTPPVSDIEIINIVTIVSSEVSSSVDSSVETRFETSVGTESSVVDSKVEIRTEIGDIKPTETIIIPGSSTRVIDSSTIVFFTDFIAGSTSQESDSDATVSTKSDQTESVTTDTTETTLKISPDSTETVITDTTEAVTLDTTKTVTSDTTETLDSQEITSSTLDAVAVDVSSSKDIAEDHVLSTPTPVFVPSDSPSIKDAVTSTITLETSTEFVGNDHETTKLPAGALLIIVTGTDGTLTRVTEAKVTAYADTINPTVPLVDEELPSTQASNKPTIKPGSVIELSDLLGGNSNLGGNIGEAIKGIVNLITAGKKKNDTTEHDVQPEAELPPLPPRTGVTVSQREEPVYIPIGAIGEQPDSQEPQPIFTPVDQLTERTNARPDIGPVYQPEPTLESGHHFTPGVLVKGFTPLKDSEESVENIDKATEKADTERIKTDVITGAKTVFLFPSTSDDHTTKEFTTELQGSVESHSVDQVSSSSETPAIQGTSVITGAKTIFLGDFNIKGTKEDKKTLSGDKNIFFGTDGSKFTIQPTENKEPSIQVAGFTPLATSRREGDAYTTIVKDGQTIVSKSSSGAKTIFFPLGGQAIQPSKSSSESPSTTFVTRVESLTRTLTLTTTKIYYTRDSPITITSVLTTTIPPRTFVSTIVGSRTILGTVSEPTETVELQSAFRPTESTTTITTTTKIFNSIATTVVRTLVIPTKTTAQTVEATRSPEDTEIFEAGTEKPAKPPESADSTSSIIPNDQPKFVFGSQTTPRSASGRRPLLPFKAPTREPPTSPKTSFAGVKPRVPFPTRPPTTTSEKTTPSPPKFTTKRPQFGITDPESDQGCYPECNQQNMEICKNNDGSYSCECRPGFARKDGKELCEEVQTYVVTLRVVKMGESAVSYRTEFSNSLTTEFQQFAEMAKKGIDEAYKSTDVRENYVGSDVRSIVDTKDLDTSANDIEGVLVNFTVQVSRNPPVSESQLKEELTRSLKKSNYSVGGTDLYVSPQAQGAGDVQDFDECSSEEFHDCGRGSFCSNLPGSYNCTCKEGFKDLDSFLPGRICSGEITNCDYCNGRGDCITSFDGRRSCSCHRMYVGRRCEINGLVLAITLPIAAALVVLLVCCLFCCCRRYRRHKGAGGGGKGNVFKGMGLINPLTGTLDRKAMIMDTSSESSESHPPRGHHMPQTFDGFAETDSIPKKGSKKSDLSLDRSLSTGFSVPHVMIPRARHQHPKQVPYPMYPGYMW